MGETGGKLAHGGQLIRTDHFTMAGVLLLHAGADLDGDRLQHCFQICHAWVR